jgi:mono/diheme cytochrome c family protein
VRPESDIACCGLLMKPVRRRDRARRVFALLAAAGLIVGLPLAGADDKFPDGPGKAILLKVCTQCHSADPIAALHRTKDEWKDTLDAMKGYGAEATDEELGVILDYLVKNFGKQ